ncbi:unnamed protein product, partial [Ectocarpus fasciculatus]
KPAKGSEAYTVANCLVVPPPTTGDTRGGVPKQNLEVVEEMISSMEQRCVTGEGLVDKDHMLSMLLLALHRRVKFLPGLQQKRNQQKRNKADPLMPPMPRQEVFG